MKSLLLLTALVGLFTVTLTGCGGPDTTVVESASPTDGALEATQEDQYEKAMKSGGSGRNSMPKTPPPAQ